MRTILTKMLKTALLIILAINLTELWADPIFGCPYLLQQEKHRLKRSQNPPKEDNKINFITPGPKSLINLPDMDENRACHRSVPICRPNSPYRSFDGSCNNLKNPFWGTPNTPYTRLLPAQYGDNVQSPSVSQCGTGNLLPLPREVTLALFPDAHVEDPFWTLALMQYGQVISHDLSLMAAKLDAEKRCCTDGQVPDYATRDKNCYPIILPENDPFHSESNASCLNFVRTATSDVNGKKEQLTAVNHYLDLSVIYGESEELAGELREFDGGRLKVDCRNGQQWPIRATNSSTVCFLEKDDDVCYKTGDSRVNQNAQLTLLLIILLREHNRVARVLELLNPQWKDEELFQEARRICIAQHQHISYYEWLPIVIGFDNAVKNKIIYNLVDSRQKAIDDYNKYIDPAVINEHATSAARTFHSAVAGRLALVAENRDTFDNLRFTDWLLRPKILEEGSNFNDLGRGLMTQPELENDEFHDSEITSFLIRNNKLFPADLKTLDVQRNRDHGLASYNDMREYCGLHKAATFEDFHDWISVKNVRKLKQLYACPDDVDLTVGGTLERHVNRTLVGPTNLCILTRQFYKTRVADRFWFEHSQNNNGFSPKQLKELRKASLARLICDNADIISMQPKAFDVISETNKVVSCDKIIQVDLSLWGAKDKDGQKVDKDDDDQEPLITILLNAADIL